MDHFLRYLLHMGYLPDTIQPALEWELINLLALPLSAVLGTAPLRQTTVALVEGAIVTNEIENDRNHWWGHVLVLYQTSHFSDPGFLAEAGNSCVHHYCHGKLAAKELPALTPIQSSGSCPLLPNGHNIQMPCFKEIIPASPSKLFVYFSVLTVAVSCWRKMS